MIKFQFKIIVIYLLIYIVGLFFSFLSEFTYKKREFSEIKKDYKRIWRNASLVYGVFVIASVVYYLFGIKAE
jgi:hypothetical protein